MATKEDMLEQVVEEYLINQGYFVQHNIKFRPNPKHPDYITNEDSNHSDIDVLGYHPNKSGSHRVVAVSCKSWQGGFRTAYWLDAINKNKIVSGRRAWKGFRELTSAKWSEAFREVIYEKTGSRDFTYVIAVSNCKGEKEIWEQEDAFLQAMAGNPIKVLTFAEIVGEMNDLGTTLAPTEVGRLLQLFKAAEIDIGVSD